MAVPIKKSEATCTRILDAALDLFRTRGFEETTMRGIAAAAGVSFLGLGTFSLGVHGLRHMQARHVYISGVGSNRAVHLLSDARKTRISAFLIGVTESPATATFADPWVPGDSCALVGRA